MTLGQAYISELSRFSSGFVPMTSASGLGLFLILLGSAYYFWARPAILGNVHIWLVRLEEMPQQDVSGFVHI